MKKHHLALAGLVIAAGSLAYEMINKNNPKKETIEKFTHMGIAIGLGLITLCVVKKD
jgi:hypothetical protein